MGIHHIRIGFADGAFDSLLQTFEQLSGFIVSIRGSLYEIDGPVDDGLVVRKYDRHTQETAEEIQTIPWDRVHDVIVR